MRYVPVMLAAILAACSSSKQSDKIDPTILPTDYKDQILRYIPDVLDDPTNIKDAFVTEPFLIKVSETSSLYVVCVRGNPRDLNRRYTGNKELIAYFLGGRINQLITAKPEQCAKAAYKPFPELEKYCRADKCA